MRSRRPARSRYRKTSPLINASGKSGINPLTLDPSRTGTIRRGLIADWRLRVARLKGKVISILTGDNALAPSLNAFCPTGVGGGVDPSCSPGGKSSGANVVSGKTGGSTHDEGHTPAASEHPEAKGLVGKLKAVGAAVGHVEHLAAEYVSDRVRKGVDKLPPRAQEVVEGAWGFIRGATKAAFSNFTVMQSLAEQVSRERGATPEEARALRGTLSTIDSKTFEVLKIAAISGVHAAHLPAVISATLPVATTSYLAYSTARNPAATARAAGKLVDDFLHPATPGSGTAERTRRLGVERLGRNQQVADTATTNSAVDTARVMAHALDTHGYDDWYVAILSCALDRVGKVSDAVPIANDAYRANPVGKVTPRDDDADVVLGLRADDDSPVGNQSSTAASVPQSPSSTFLGGSRVGDGTSLDWLVKECMSTLLSQDMKVTLVNALGNAYRVGALRAYDDVRAAGKGSHGSRSGAGAEAYLASRGEVVRILGTSPQGREQVMGRVVDTYGQLAGVIAGVLSPLQAVGSAIPSTVTSLLSAISDPGLSEQGASILAASVVGAHADGQLEMMGLLGTEEVYLKGEVNLDGSKCEVCSGLGGSLLPLAEAQGVIPMHHGCRCAWLPQPVTRAKVSNQDLVALLGNAFCPTGEGGGVDPSCGPSAGAGSKGGKKPTKADLLADKIKGLTTQDYRTAGHLSALSEVKALPESGVRKVHAALGLGGNSSSPISKSEALATIEAHLRSNYQRHTGIGTAGVTTPATPPNTVTPATPPTTRASTPATTTTPVKPPIHTSPQERVGKVGTVGVSPVTSEHVKSLLKAYQEHPDARHGIVDVADLSRTTGMGHEQTLATVRHLRERGVLTGSNYEGRSGLGSEQQRVVDAQKGHQDTVGYVSVRDEDAFRRHLNGHTHNISTDKNDDGDGGWVTVKDGPAAGQRVYISGGGHFLPGGPGSEPVMTSAGKKTEVEKAGGRVYSLEDIRKVMDDAHPTDHPVRSSALKQFMSDHGTDAGHVMEHGMAQPEGMKTLTMGSLKVSWNHDNEFVGRSMAHILTRDTPAALMKATREVVFTSQQNKDDAYWNNLHGYTDNVKAEATGGDGKIVVYNTTLPHESFLHESGHNLANKEWGSTTPSERSAYARAQAKEEPVSSYAYASRDEDFAEAVRLHSSGNKQAREYLRKEYPMKSAAIDELLEKHK